jgi:MFS family permease
VDAAAAGLLNDGVTQPRGRLAVALAAIGDVVKHPPLLRAEVAYAAAWTGECAFTVGLAVLAFRNGGAAAVGVVSLLRMVPAAILAPVLTAVADRMARDRVLVAASVVRTAALGTGAVLLMAQAPSWTVYALAVLETIAFTVFRPVHSALLPALCTTTSQLTSANVARGVVDSSGALLGPLLAGVLLAVRDESAVFVAAALLSLVAALLLVRLRYEAVHNPQHHPTTLGRAAVEGVRAVVGERDLVLIVGLGFAQTVVRGALNVFIVVVALTQLQTGDGGVAVLAAALGAGGVLGSLGVSLLVGSRHLGGWLAVALVLWGAPIAVMSTASSEQAAFALLAVVGIGNAIIDVPLFTLPVRLAADAVLARVFGVFESLVALGVGLGAVIAPALIAVVDERGALVLTGLVLPLLAVLSWRRLTDLDRRLGVRDDEIDMLRNAPMLRALPVPSIEHLASRVQRRRFAAGAVVFDQGDDGRAFYVIVDGHADVMGDGVLIATMGPGDSFGEVALVGERPRTAGVRARSALQLLELDDGAFLDAVGGYHPSSDAASAVVARHLANFRPG